MLQQNVEVKGAKMDVQSLRTVAAVRIGCDPTRAWAGGRGPRGVGNAVHPGPAGCGSSEGAPSGSNRRRRGPAWAGSCVTPPAPGRPGARVRADLLSSRQAVTAATARAGAPPLARDGSRGRPADQSPCNDSRAERLYCGRVQCDWSRLFASARPPAPAPPAEAHGPGACQLGLGWSMDTRISGASNAHVPLGAKFARRPRRKRAGNAKRPATRGCTRRPSAVCRLVQKAAGAKPRGAGRSRALPVEAAALRVL
jgi:hypothetical protein